MAERVHRPPRQRQSKAGTNSLPRQSPGALDARGAVAQAREIAARLNARPKPAPRQASAASRNGLPGDLKAGMEAISGIALDDVRVHRNSPMPAQLQAHAYAQGADIHLAPGQDRHLPHEAWHVVQQKQGRVRPTLRANGAAINDDPALEREADVMGNRATVQPKMATTAVPLQRVATGDVAQCILIKVTTRKELASRVVDKVQFAERVPTTASGGQGDHTVAEALVELALEKHCRGKTHVQIATTLPQMLLHLDAEASAKYLGEDNKYHKIDLSSIEPLIARYHHEATHGAEGEDLNEALSHILEMFLRVWNKRDGSAYARKEGMTTGGTGGADEKKAKKVLTELSKRRDLEDDEEGTGWTLTAARALTKFIDFDAPKNLEEAARHLKTAVDLTVASIDDGEIHYEQIGTIAVRLFARMHGIKGKAEEELDRLTFFLLNGRTYEDF